MSGRPALSIQEAISVNGARFSLTGDDVSYHLHVDDASGDLISDHFGGLCDGILSSKAPYAGGWVDGFSNTRREFPDLGRGDFRLPAVQIKHATGSTVSEFRYHSHDIRAGKCGLEALPATFGNGDEASTLVITMKDVQSNISAKLFYSIFPRHNAITRHFEIINEGLDDIFVERAFSFSIDFPNLDLDMIQLYGDQAYEMNQRRQKINHGENSFRSTTGFSSYLHNPLIVLASPSTTESTGEAWGFNLVYSGSFAASVSRFSHGFVRVLLGVNPLHGGWTLKRNETFTSPEAVAIYSSRGLGGMSRSFHDLYRNNLSRSIYTFRPRPVLLNSWEALHFDFNQASLLELARETADLGISLFVTDDGWFGDESPRVNSSSGLGDWIPNPSRFPQGLDAYVAKVNSLRVEHSSSPRNLEFGIWVEPEMVNPDSVLYRKHPEWILRANGYKATTTRHQFVLNLAMREVQDHLINSISDVIDSANITYIKWDHNRGIHEMPSPTTDHQYILGLYRVIDSLTTKYSQVLWEGCASGGARIDPGLLHYWPQSWTSDNTDAADRLTIQLGTSLVYPLSSMAGHISAIPNGLTGRTISIEYRAHVAMWCGSFGFELKPSDLTATERSAIPKILADAARIHPLVLTGSLYRLRMPQDTNWPALQLVSADRTSSAVFAFQQLAAVQPMPPPLRLEGLDPGERYHDDLSNQTYSGSTYMNAGIDLRWRGDYQSKLIWLQKVLRD